MDAALAALIGAAVGAVVPTTERLVSAFRSRSDAREARLFDHKRQAFATYVAALRKDLNNAWEWHNESDGARGADAPPTAMDPLGLRLAEVSIYCSDSTDNAATGAHDAVVQYTFDGSADDYGKAEEAIKKFTKAARRDLGASR